MKCLWISVALAMGALCVAQPTQNARDIMAAAMQELGRVNQATLVLSGTLTAGSNQTNYTITAHVDLAPVNGKPSARMEVLHWVEGNITRRIVGDGTMLWTYDVGRNVYWADRYGNFDGGQPADLRLRMTNALRRRAVGHESFLARSLADAWGVDPFATRNTGLRGSWVPYLPAAQAWDSGDDVIAQTNVPAAISMTYDTNSTNAGYVLQSVAYNEQTQKGSLTVVDDWTTTVWRNQPPQWLPISYTFVPPAGSRPMGPGG